MRYGAAGQRWTVFAAAWAAAGAFCLAAACAKPDEGAAQEPQAGGAAAGHGTAEESSAAGGSESAAPGGLVPALEAAGVLRSGTQGRGSAPSAPPPEPERRQIFARMLVDVDVPAVLETPIWPMIRAGLEGEAEPELRCVVELLPKVQSIFATARFGRGTDVEELVLSVQTTAESSAVESCLLEATSGEARLEEGDVGGHPGYVGESEDSEPVAMVEAAPGWWLMGSRAEVEAAAEAGNAPADDPEFVAATGPLGPAAIRIVATPGPDFVAGGPEAETTPPALACFVESWPHMIGFGLGLGWRQGLDLSLVVRHGTEEAAAASGACFESTWAVVAQGVRSGLATATDPRERVLAGPATEELLSSVRFEVPGELVVMRATVPVQLIFALLARFGE
ncbi:MAG: hypothetical protein HY905_26000 [Deltaproteobacteria bacterium]|nr:hypothetical protein [Deltaproteobacteria bacterium]